MYFSTTFLMRIFNIATYFVLALCCHTTTANAQIKFVHFSASQINLNRTAIALTPKQQRNYPGSHAGFRWNKDDNKTAKWRPQGIAGFVSGNRNFLAVSWYGRKSEGYSNRGARVSIVDISNGAAIKYRHVLLVDEKFRTFHGMHAGGLVVRKNRLHVPDSRKNANRIHVFSLDRILEIPKPLRKKFFGYRYIMRKRASYSVPIKPSFLSYDWQADRLLVGSFHKCGKTHSDSESCRSHPNNKLVWVPLSNPSKAFSNVCGPFFSEMQGAASGSVAGFNRPVLWSASSYGRNGISHLHITTFNRDSCSNRGPQMGETSVVTYPPGLEDIHISKSSSNLWMLTEFGPHEGKGNNRVVFVTRREKLLPN